MADFNLDRTIAETRGRLSRTRPGRKRADAGRSRMSKNVRAILQSLLSGQQRPPTGELLAQLAERCRQHGERCPSRASVYNFLPNASGPTYPVRELPEHVRASLYNLTDESNIPGHQLAFYLFNYGDSRALGFAASLPWLCLFQAERLRGFRPKSHALLRAVMQARGI
jgi:hypothetical protein